MSTLTIRLPDDTAARLKALARSRGQSMNVTDRHNRATDDRHIEATRTGL